MIAMRQSALQVHRAAPYDLDRNAPLDRLSDGQYFRAGEFGERAIAAGL